MSSLQDRINGMMKQINDAEREGKLSEANRLTEQLTTMIRTGTIYRANAIKKSVDDTIRKSGVKDKLKEVRGLEHKPKVKTVTTDAAGFPKIWQSGGSVQGVLESDHVSPGHLEKASDYNRFPRMIMKRTDFSNFKVYVNSKDYFMANLPTPERIYLPKDDDGKKEKQYGDIRKLSKDVNKNVYFKSLAAMYVSSYLCGITAKHIEFKESVHPVITSLCRFHLYFWWSRFMRKPELMRDMDLKDLWKHLPLYRKEWTTFHQGDDYVAYVQKIMPRSLQEDFLRFIAVDGDGLTKTGTEMLQTSIEAFVYSLLGAQAKTRWSIVKKGALSQQTQTAFRQILSDTIIQTNATITISNMRKAISDCNVILNLACNPDIILLPSSCVILKKPIPGYNNVLLIANRNMSFGYNPNVNEVKVEKKPTVKKIGTETPTHVTETPTHVTETPTHVTETPTHVTEASTPATDHSNLVVLIGSAIIGKLIFMYII